MAARRRWRLFRCYIALHFILPKPQSIFPFLRPYFTAEVFGRLQAAEGGMGKVRAVSLFNYVMRRVWLQQTRIGLSLYDVTGQGYLTEHVSIILGYAIFIMRKICIHIIGEK